MGEAEWNGNSTSMELDQLRRRVAELESQLGVRKKRGLRFTVSYVILWPVCVLVVYSTLVF